MQALTVPGAGFLIVFNRAPPVTKVEKASKAKQQKVKVKASTRVKVYQEVLWGRPERKQENQYASIIIWPVAREPLQGTSVAEESMCAVDAIVRTTRSRHVTRNER